MLSITRFHRCYLDRGRTDMRKGIDSLSGLIRNELGKDPLSGELFVFFCRARRRVKILLWDQVGFALYQKRLERIHPANYVLIPVTLFRNFVFEVQWGLASYGEVARVACLWCGLVFVQTRPAASRMD